MKRTWYRQGEALQKEIETTSVAAGQIALWYLGQCGFAFKQEKILYIDPVFNDLTDEEGISRRCYPSPFAPETVRADYVLCTHGHLDHLAVETLTGIAQGDPHTLFLVPGGCRSLLTQAGIPKQRIVSLRAGIKMQLPGVEILPVSAAHPVHMVDENGEDLALSYSVTMGGIHLLHLGDTYLTDQLLHDLQALPKVHLFFPPINGGDYFRTSRDCIGNLSPIESATLAKLLGVDLTIPTHFDMVEGNTTDPLVFVRELWQQDPAAKWHIPALGERFIYQLYPLTTLQCFL
jgi:L-ascorbate metabolism protein UlaG (beta-lactamase superfamily)